MKLNFDVIKFFLILTMAIFWGQYSFLTLNKSNTEKDFCLAFQPNMLILMIFKSIQISIVFAGKWQNFVMKWENRRKWSLHLKFYEHWTAQITFDSLSFCSAFVCLFCFLTLPTALFMLHWLIISINQWLFKWLSEWLPEWLPAWLLIINHSLDLGRTWWVALCRDISTRFSFPSFDISYCFNVYLFYIIFQPFLLSHLSETNCIWYSFQFLLQEKPTFQKTFYCFLAPHFVSVYFIDSFYAFLIHIIFADSI